MPLLLTLLAVAASALLSPPATRAEVATQRLAIERQFAHEKAECERRFIVSTCLEDVRKRHQGALAPLIRHEQELDAAERLARAAAQAERVKERELAAAQEEGQRRQRLVAAPPPAAPATPASHVSRARSPEAVQRERLQAQRLAEAEAAKRRERSEERQQRMRERLAEHEAKEKARTQPHAAPLPLPGASAASK
ncbi:MAG: hypothetical protein EOP39_22270 [Rubrivivax sp.]|nr:MAG: hypothetical protein EOP39_22270 [Rubrivivax sp.]